MNDHGTNSNQRATNGQTETRTTTEIETETETERDRNSGRFEEIPLYVR